MPFGRMIGLVQPNVLVLDPSAQRQARKLAVVVFRPANTPYSSASYLRGVIDGERSIGGSDMSGREWRTGVWYRYAGLRAQLLGALTAHGVPHLLWTGRHCKRILVLGPAGLDDAALQRLADQQSRAATEWSEERSSSANWATRRFVASSAALSMDTLERLARDRDARVRRAVASRPSTPAAVLSILVADANDSVRTGAALNRSAGPHELGALAADDCERVRRAVAGNPATPLSILAMLAASSDLSVRITVAANPAIDDAIVTRLLEDPHRDIRYAAARHPACPEHLRAIIALGAE